MSERLNPDKACVHPDFAAQVNVHRLYNEEGIDPATYPDAFAVEIRIECAVCHEPFRFIGLKAGLMPDRPMVNASEDELRVPIRPASSDPDYGLGIPGFAINYREEPT